MRYFFKVDTYFNDALKQRYENLRYRYGDYKDDSTISW